jgi:hypothetical protein
VNDVPHAFDYLMCADTHHLSPRDMEAMVRCVEEVLITAALESLPYASIAMARKF